MTLIMLHDNNNITQLHFFPLNSNQAQVQTGLNKLLHPSRYLSLWPLLQSLQERGDIIVVINGELHFLTHNANGNILKEGEICT